VIGCGQWTCWITFCGGWAGTLEFVSHHQIFGQNFEDMARRVPDISKIQNFVGYKPSVHLEEILARTIDYWAPKHSIAMPARHIVARQPQLAAV